MRPMRVLATLVLRRFLLPSGTYGTADCAGASRSRAPQPFAVTNLEPRRPAPTRPPPSTKRLPIDGDVVPALGVTDRPVVTPLTRTSP